MSVTTCCLTGDVHANAPFINGYVTVIVHSALGNLVNIHHPPESASPHHILHPVTPSVSGSSCVALVNPVGSKTSATHGALSSSAAVASRSNGSAVAVCSVGVHAKRDDRTSSGTSTPPPQLPVLHVAKGVVDVVAEYERERDAATPTTPTAPIDLVAMVPSPPADAHRLLFNNLAGSTNDKRLRIDTSHTPHAPASSSTSSSSLPYPSPVWEDAFAKAGSQSDVAATRAGSLGLHFHTLRMAQHQSSGHARCGSWIAL